MKKILSVFAAAAVLFGFASCGDLHDLKSIDMSAVNVVGTITGWSFTPMTKAEDGSYWYYEFTPTAESNNFTLIENSAWGGPDAFRGDKDGNFIETMTAGETYVTTKLDSLNCPAITLSVGTPYTIKAIPMEGGQLSVSVIAGVTPPTLSVVSGSENKTMSITGAGIYTYKFTAPDTSFTFKVFDGENNYGTTAASVKLDEKIALSKAKDAKPLVIATDNAKDYVITVTISEENELSVVIEKDALKAWIIGDITNGNFTRMNNASLTVVTYNFTYDAKTMTAWGGSASGINFKVIDKDSWVGETVYFKNVKVTVGSDFVNSSSVDGNATAVLVDGKNYTFICDATDPENIKGRIIPGKQLYIAGGMNGWKHEELSYDATSAYYDVKENLTDQGFKVCLVPDWKDEVFFGATVSTEEVACGETGDAKVSANVGQKIRVYEKDGKYYAKVE